MIPAQFQRFSIQRQRPRVVALVARQIAEVPQRQDDSLAVPRLPFQAKRLFEMRGGQRVLTVRPRGDGEIDRDPPRQDPRQPAVRHTLRSDEGLLQERGAAAMVTVQDGQRAEPDQRKGRMERVAQRPAAGQPLCQADLRFLIRSLVDLNHAERDEGFRPISRRGAIVRQGTLQPVSALLVVI